MNDKPVVEDAKPFDPASAGWDMVEPLGFGELIGPLWQRGEGPSLRFGFVVTAKHLNFNNILHGGMLATLADQSMGMTAQRATGIKPHVTIELNIHFIGTVRLGEFVEAHCEVVRAARSIIFMQAKLVAGTRIVGSATGIWKNTGRP
jgi:uncharacterized protein (TIGR00369 family)